MLSKIVSQDPTNPTFREKMKEFMQKFDKNKDGRIEMSEVRPQRTFLFYRFYLTEQLDCLGNMHFCFLSLIWMKRLIQNVYMQLHSLAWHKDQKQLGSTKDWFDFLKNIPSQPGLRYAAENGQMDGLLNILYND